MRDENGFKMHTQSESHVRQMLLVGEDPKKYINDFSDQFLRDFLQLLKTSHGEKQVNAPHFYNEYIANKEHVHMNATKWPSLTEFVKYLGREGICRVEETEKGLHISWIDDSPEALRRKEAIRRKEMQDKGDEEREQRMIREQIKRANRESGRREGDDEDPEDRGLKRQDGGKISLAFGGKPAAKPDPAATATSLSPPPPPSADAKPADDPDVQDAAEGGAKVERKRGGSESRTESAAGPNAAAGPVSFKASAKPQTKNVFAAAKKNVLAGPSKKNPAFEQPKKMSEAERIMKEEIEKKRSRRSSGLGGFSLPNKRQKT